MAPIPTALILSGRASTNATRRKDRALASHAHAGRYGDDCRPFEMAFAAKAHFSKEFLRPIDLPCRHTYLHRMIAFVSLRRFRIHAGSLLMRFLPRAEA